MDALYRRLHLGVKRLSQRVRGPGRDELRHRSDLVHVYDLVYLPDCNVQQHHSNPHPIFNLLLVGIFLV